MRPIEMPGFSFPFCNCFFATLYFERYTYPPKVNFVSAHEMTECVYKSGVANGIYDEMGPNRQKELTTVGVDG